MENNAVSYSEAIYSLSKEQNMQSEILADLSLVCEVVFENKKYINIMDAPDIDFNAKKSLIDEAFSGRVSPYVLNFLKIISQKRLFSELFKIKDEYEKSYNKEFNIEKAEIITSAAISDTLKEKIIKKLSDLTKKTVKAEFRVDKSILAGVVIKLEQEVLDASFKHNLEEIKKVIGR